MKLDVNGTIFIQKKKENSWISDKIRANTKIQTYAAKDQIWLAYLFRFKCLSALLYYSFDIYCQKFTLITQHITLSNKELGHLLLQRCS